MASYDKYYKLAGQAFENALRLHFDAIRMYELGSYATSYQLALLASEELGKALMLNEYCWQYYANNWKDHKGLTEKYLTSIFTNHVDKQRYFAYMANDFINRNPYFGKKSSILKALETGLGEDAKQNTTYVGLLKKGRRLDLKAKTTNPLKFGTESRAERQISLNSDFLRVYTDGFLKGVFSIDVYDIANSMDKELLESLEIAWPKLSRDAKAVLKRFKDVEYLSNPLENWEE